MIKIEATAGKKHDNQEGVELSFLAYGEAYSILEESIAIIRATMDNLKKKDKVLHLIALSKIMENPEILTCQNTDKIKVLAEREVKISKNGEMKS